MDQYLTKLNQEQYNAATAGLGPILVVAGAGTGKTSVLTARIVFLMNELKIDQNRILAFTFTNKAADEMKSRISKVANKKIPWMGTFHSVCQRILREDINIINAKHSDSKYDRNFKLLNEDTQTSLINSLVDELGLSRRDYKAKDIVKMISLIKTIYNSQYHLITEQSTVMKRLQIYDINEARNYQQIIENYLASCRHLNYLDFDDLLNFVNEIFKLDEHVLKKWQQKFDYVLVDEFQDTNIIQYQIIKFLSDKHNNVFVVGDPDQMIYSFRGANNEIIENFSLNHPDTKTIILKTNYRSTAQILKPANTLIDKNNGKIKKHLEAFLGNGDKPKYFNAERQEKEADFVADEVKKLIEIQNIEPKNIAILFRSAFYSRNIEQSLMSRGISYNIIGAYKFYRREEIADMIGYLSVINDFDELHLFRIVNKPARGITTATIKNVKNFADQMQVSIFEAFRMSEDNPSLTKAQIKACLSFYELIQELKEDAKTTPLSLMIDKIFEKSKYYELLQKDEKGEERKQNINELKNAINNYMIYNPNNTLNDYLNDVALYDSSNEKQRDDAITLMTVHASKGLEFEIVFVIGFNEGTFPSSNASGDQKGMQEERRIAYVALTRAKKILYITSAGGYNFNDKTERKPSSFIKEMGYDNLETIKTQPTFTRIFDLNSSSYRQQYLQDEEDNSWFDSQAAAKKSKENYNEEQVNDYQIGEKIVHTEWGIGQILGIDGNILTILFKKFKQPKQLLFNHKSIVRRKG